MLRKPSTLLCIEAIGSSMERGTLPRAAWCSTSSTEPHASRQVSKERMSPWMNLKFFAAFSPTLFFTSDKFSGLPVEKLSRPTTFWPARSRVSARWEPMKPAAPVTSQVRWRALVRSSSSSEVFMRGSLSLEFEEHLFVALDHGALAELRFHHFARALAQARGGGRVGEEREAIHQRAGIADRIQ